MKVITKHYIDGAFVESHGREVLDSVNPSNGKVVARATLGDEEDARRAVAAAKSAFTSFSFAWRSGIPPIGSIKPYTRFAV